MKKFLHYIVFLVILSMLSSCISDDSGVISQGNGNDSLIDGTPVEMHGRLSVSGTKLIDKYGKTVQLKGMSTHGIQYYPDFYSENLIQALAEDWGIDIIRISNYINEGSEDTYLYNPAKWRTFVDTIVDLAEKYGIYALIDWHMLSPGDPNHYIDEAKEFWSYMVDKHGDKEHVLFDICNEPNNEGSWDGTVAGKTVNWQDHIKPYAETIMDIIRPKSQNVAIVGTPQWASRPDLVKGNKLNHSNVMYTMHFYAASHGNSYRDYVSSALRGGVPVFVTEFGTQESSGDGENDFSESKAWLNFLDQNDISWINWNVSNDPRTGGVFKRYTEKRLDSLAAYRESHGWSTITSEESDDIRNGTLVSYGSVESYSDETKIKEAGIWIKSQF